jgi:hypothetical protein
VEGRPGRRRLRKGAITLAGGSVVGLGVVLLPLPGPGTAIIAGGLAILGTEYPAARRALDRLTSGTRRLLGQGPGGESDDGAAS